MMLPEFRESINNFLLFARTEKNLSAHTYRAYAGDLKQVVLFWEAVQEQEKKIYGLSYIINRYGNALYSQKINKSSIARKLSCFSSYKKFLERENILIELSFERPLVIPKEPEFLTTQEVEYLIERVEHTKIASPKPYRDKAIVELFYATGIRCSELITIRIHDIDVTQQLLRIRGKGKRERTIALSSQAGQKITRYLAHERVPVKSNAEYLFLNFRNEPLTTRSIQRICRIFSKFLSRKCMITPHLLRHSCAVHLLQNGAGDALVQEYLGITDIEKYKKIIAHK